MGMGGAAIGMSNDFDAAMANVSTLVDATRESMDRMGADVMRIGKRIPVELERLPEALYDIRSAGIPAADAMKVLERSARLGVAGLGSTQEAADLVTSSINAFGLKGKEAERIYDLIFKTVKNGKTNIAQLSQGFGAVAGTISAANVPLDEYLASVAALTTTGMPAAQAHTHLRAVISGMTRDTEDSRKVLGALGAKDFKGLIQQSGGLVPALGRIRQQLNGNDGAMQKLFGSTEALNAVTGLTTKQAAVFGSTLNDMRNGANAVDTAFGKQSNTDMAKRVQDMNRMKAAAIEMGEKAAPALTTFFEMIGGLADRFSNLSPETQKFILIAGGILAVIGPVIAIIGGLITVIGVLAPVFGVVFGVLSAVISAIASPVLAIIAVIGLLSWAIYANWDAIKAAFGTGIAWLQQKWVQFKTMFFTALAFVLGLRARFIQAGGDLITGLINGFMGKVGQLKNRIVQTAANIKNWFADKLGIRSPSRVFMALGGHVMSGLDRGLDRGEGKPLGRIRDLAAGMTAALAVGTATPALSAGGAGVGAAARSAAAPVSPTFNIYQQPGQSVEDLAKEIEKILARLARQQAANDRSSYRDDD
nr:phage tail tape measure protein [Novosphingopyxis sp. YJ-S2-01]